MNFKPLLDMLHTMCLCVLITVGVFVALDLWVTISMHIQNWLRANRNMNNEVPRLKAALKELEMRQALLESDFQNLRRSLLDEPGTGEAQS